MDRNMKYRDMQTLAATLGINGVGMAKDALIAAIEAAEGSAVTPAPVYEKPEYAEEPEADVPDGAYGEDFDDELEETETPAATPAQTAAPVDPVMVAVIAAQKAAEEYMRAHPTMQVSGKPETSEQEIAARQARDAAAIEKDKKREFGLSSGMGIGEPKVYIPCVNGKKYAIVPGTKKALPEAVCEVMERSLAQRRKNLKTQEAKSRAAKNEGI